MNLETFCVLGAIIGFGIILVATIIPTFRKRAGLTLLGALVWSGSLLTVFLMWEKELTGLPAPEYNLEHRGFYKVLFSFRNPHATNFDYLVGLQPLKLPRGSSEFAPNGRSKVFNFLSRSIPTSMVGHVVVANKDDSGVALVELGEPRSAENSTNSTAENSTNSAGLQRPSYEGRGIFEPQQLSTKPRSKDN